MDIKKAVIVVMLLMMGLDGWGDELKHIIHDIDVYGKDNWEETKCIDGTNNHLFINLSEEDWKKVINSQIKEKREYFQADFCIKCRLIVVRSTGNDLYRYVLSYKERKKEKITYRMDFYR